MSVTSWHRIASSLAGSNASRTPFSHWLLGDANESNWLHSLLPQRSKNLIRLASTKHLLKYSSVLTQHCKILQETTASCEIRNRMELACHRNAHLSRQLCGRTQNLPQSLPLRNASPVVPRCLSFQPCPEAKRRAIQGLSSCP